MVQVSYMNAAAPSAPPHGFFACLACPPAPSLTAATQAAAWQVGSPPSELGGGAGSAVTPRSSRQRILRSSAAIGGREPQCGCWVTSWHTKSAMYCKGRCNIPTEES